MAKLGLLLPDNPYGLERRDPMEEKTGLMEMTTDIVSSFVSQNTISTDALPDLIRSIYSALNNIGSAPVAVAAEPQKPAVPIKKSITDDFLISLEDGRKYKSLKRHLRTAYGMSPDDYRSKWNLDKNYPMVAPAYAASRSALAKSMGLGRGGAAAVAVKTPAKRGPKPKPTA